MNIFRSKAITTSILFFACGIQLIGTSNCESDDPTESCTNFEAVAYETSSQTSCLIGDGAVLAGVIVNGDTITGGYSFAWYETDTLGTSIGSSHELGGIDQGDYIVVITSEDGCRAFAEVTITDQTEFDLYAETGTNSSCDPERPNGVLSAGIVIAGLDTITENYTFNWYEGENFENLVSSSPVAESFAGGTYSVIAINDISGCQDTSSVTLEDAELIIDAIIFETHAVTSLTEPNGALSARVLIGTDTLTEGYTFSWYIGSTLAEEDFISTGPDAGNLEATLYSVLIVSDETKCQTTLSQVVNTEIID